MFGSTISDDAGIGKNFWPDRQLIFLRDDLSTPIFRKSSI